eukprot:3384422-Amphidinium_carterae.1
MDKEVAPAVLRPKALSKTSKTKTGGPTGCRALTQGVAGLNQPREVQPSNGNDMTQRNKVGKRSLRTTAVMKTILLLTLL